MNFPYPHSVGSPQKKMGSTSNEIGLLWNIFTGELAILNSVFFSELVQKRVHQWELINVSDWVSLFEICYDSRVSISYAYIPQSRNANDSPIWYPRQLFFLEACARCKLLEVARNKKHHFVFLRICTRIPEFTENHFLEVCKNVQK